MKIWPLFLLLVLAFCQCGGKEDHKPGKNLTAWFKQEGRIKVLSTTCMISDLVEQIGGAYVDNITLICRELDPHSYQLVKGDSEKLEFADLIFHNGLGLEHGPSLHHYLRDSETAVAVGNAIAQDRPDQVLIYDGQPDPHIWMDVSLWARAVPAIARTLAQHDPEHAATYQANAEKLVTNMQRTHTDIRQQMQSIPSQKRFLVTSHDAFNYFTRAYLADENERLDGTWEKRFQAPEGLSPDSQLSYADIQFILDHMTKYQISVIFPESNVSRDSLRKILRSGSENGLKIRLAEVALYGDAMGAPGTQGDTYLGMIQYNANTLAEHLNGHIN